MCVERGHLAAVTVGHLQSSKFTAVFLGNLAHILLLGLEFGFGKHQATAVLGPESTHHVMVSLVLQQRDKIRYSFK